MQKTSSSAVWGMDVFARNVGERIMSVIVLGFAVIIFSSVLASVPWQRPQGPGCSRIEKRLKKPRFFNVLMINNIW